MHNFATTCRSARRTWGATVENLADEANLARIMREFEERGLLIFEDVDPSPDIQLAISAVIGELKDHPIAAANAVPFGSQV